LFHILWKTRERISRRYFDAAATALNTIDFKNNRLSQFVLALAKLDYITSKKIVLENRKLKIIGIAANYLDNRVCPWMAVFSEKVGKIGQRTNTSKNDSEIVNRPFDIVPCNHRIRQNEKPGELPHLAARN